MIHDVIPVKDLTDDQGLPTTPYYLLSGSKPNVKHFKVFGYSAGWLFYVPDAKRTFVSMDAVFDEDFTSALSTPDLPFTGAIRLRNITSNYDDNNIVTEHTGERNIQTFKDKNDSSGNRKETKNTRVLRSAKRGRKYRISGEHVQTNGRIIIISRVFKCCT